MSEIVYTHRTRSGLKARIVCDNAKKECPIVALVLVDDFEFIVKLYSDLREYNDTTESYYDLFEYNPWKDVAVDTPVYVSNDNINWKNDIFHILMKTIFMHGKMVRHLGLHHIRSTTYMLNLRLNKD